MSSSRQKAAYKPISDYGLIGNRRSAALVGIDGSIDWCCFPRFDSPSVFAAILDAKKGGQFSITPREEYTSTQRYVGDTNVLETEFVMADGVATVTDCMPLYEKQDGTLVELHQIIRYIQCQKGTVAFQIIYTPRPDYARVSANLSNQGDAVIWSDQERSMILRSPVPLEVVGDEAQGVFTLREGEGVVFVLSYRDATTPEEKDGLTPQERLERTHDYWGRKAEEVDCEGPLRTHVVRSYLVLHLLTYRSTGGIVAAPTTSLPEKIGGVRNWDYRYTWLRDAAFTIQALLTLGHRDEALSFFRWLDEVCTECIGQDHIQIVSRVDGSTDMAEETLSHLEGYCRSEPVRIGNDASDQVQHDVYGEVLASAHLLATSGESINDTQWELLRELANQAEPAGRSPIAVYGRSVAAHTTLFTPRSCVGLPSTGQWL